MPTISVQHEELVQAVQLAMAAQLERDGYLTPDTELGLLFYAERPEEMRVVGSVRRGGQILFQMKGSRADLCAVAANLALGKLSPAQSRGLSSSASVRWRTFRLTEGPEPVGRFLAEVEFQYRA